jgi:hypothetical protein
MVNSNSEAELNIYENEFKNKDYKMTDIDRSKIMDIKINLLNKKIDELFNIYDNSNNFLETCKNFHSILKFIFSKLDILHYKCSDKCDCFKDLRKDIKNIYFELISDIDINYNELYLYLEMIELF